MCRLFSDELNLDLLENLLGAARNLFLSLPAFEHEAQLFQSPVVCLGEEGIHSSDLDQDPDAVEYVVLPAKGIEGNGVDVGVEEHSPTYGELLEGDALGALSIWEDLDEVGICESVPPDVVEAVGVEWSACVLSGHREGEKDTCTYGE